MHARTVPLVLALVPAARSAAGVGDECAAHMERSAFDAVTKQPDWAELHEAIRRFKRCGDGVIAEGYSDIVAILLARHWHTLPQLAPLVDTAPAF